VADPSSRQGAAYQSEEIREYIDRLHHVEDDAMGDAVRAIGRNRLSPIQIGPGDGAAIAAILTAAGARRVVEIGTLTGYSALWILRALPPDGHLWTLEADPAAAAAARGVFERAGELDRVTVVEGPALRSLERLESEGPFDAVFIDADKTSYPEYALWAFAHLRQGGVLMADNAFLFGYLAGREPDGRASAAQIDAMRRFHQLLAERCPARACLPTPDGLAVAVLG